jgi:hypothetical protein
VRFEKSLLSSVLFVALASLLALPALADVVYSTMPSPIPPNVPSLGYQATQTAEFGQGVVLAGGATTLSSADVLMSDWALKSTWDPSGTSTGFTVPLTLNIYNVGAGDSVGSLIGSVTTNASILWRPEASSGCTGGAFMGSDGGCYNGLAQTVTFNLGNLAVPGQFIYGLAFNTETWGANPIGVDGPYDSLNFGVLGDGITPVTPSVGSDLVANSAYWNTSTAANYGDGGAGGTGTFRLDANDWMGFDPAITFDSAVPEPRFVGLLTGLIALAGLLVARRRQRA